PGQVARALARPRPDAQYLSRADADLTDPAACGRAIRRSNAEAVINAAAFTAVDKAETEKSTAFLVNAAAPAEMAQAAAELGIPFVQISTDYVFDGHGKRPFAPEDPVAPLCIYGESKLEGERGVRAAKGAHVIFRTSWVFSADSNNFVKSMLRLAATHDKLNIVADQSGGPTPAADIARSCLHIAKSLSAGTGPSGTYHFAGAPDVSWAEFASVIFAQAGLNVAVEPIATEAYPTPARRPANSRLDCTSLERDFGLLRPDWRVGLHRVLSELKEQRT
ncbi:MAG: dTDP-4-dehydrorhamnose reductase, partial [Halocynthiibacter sp.]